MCRGVAVVVVLALLAALVNGTATVAVAVVSDLHLNLGNALSCSAGHGEGGGQTAQQWCDAPVALVEAALGHLAAQERCPAALLVSGDTLRHHGGSGSFTPDDGVQTLLKMQDMVSAAYAGCAQQAVQTPIVALGNNDLLERYPAPPAAGQSDPWLVRIAATLRVTQSLPLPARTVFEQSGFYAVDVPAARVRVLVLHTNYWSAQNTHTATDPDPAGGLAWLSKELARARSDHAAVWLMGHIAPGVDHYSLKATWHVHLSASYYAIVRPYLQDGTVRASFFGHEHAILERRSVPPGDDEGFVQAPVWLAGSVSPDKGNYPSVRVVSVSNATLAVADVRDWYLPLGTDSGAAWELLGGGSFAEQFGSDAPSNVTRLGAALQGSAVLASRYALRSVTDTPGLCGENCAKTIVCDVVQLDATEFAKCTATLTPSDWSGTLGFVGGMVGVATVAMIIAVCWRRRQALTQSRQLAFQWTESFDAFEDEVDLSDSDTNAAASQV